MIKFRSIIALFAISSMVACKNNTSKDNAGKDTSTAQEVKLASPDFNADSAYAFVKKQVDFGPRIPSTAAHAACAKYLENQLKSYNGKVTVQSAPIKTFDGKSHTLKNILASFYPEKKKRILITAHWDARPFSDQDPDPAMHTKAFDAANDGGSGVGVILEMARLLKDKEPNVGVDFILWDAEDYGKANDQGENEPTWCLGSQYWAKNPPTPGYQPLFAINLDMVGGANAQFTMDEVSRQYASDIIKKVWDIGNEIGYSSYFVYLNSGRLVDDHFWVNQAKIPCIDIIHYSDNIGFYTNWHTQKDNMEGIDKSTLKAVGQTMLEVIFREDKAS